MNLSSAWKHLAAFVFSALVFAIATAFLVLGRASIATSLPLLLVVVGGYIAALAVAFPAESTKARAQLELWRAAWNKNPGSPSAPGKG